MPTYNAEVEMQTSYVVEADNHEQALDFVLDMAKEDYPDVTLFDVHNVTEVK